ncbi:MAG: DUF934 domain-containing protein [Pseudomonadota bacterium]
MTQIITKTGFVEETYQGQHFPFSALWDGQDLPESPFAIVLSPDSDPFDLVPWFERVDLVIIPFATSADGRGFSLARRLRHLGYRGCIRAHGHILVDQFRAALAVGIDEVEISADQARRMPQAQWQAVALDAPRYQSRLRAA